MIIGFVASSFDLLHAGHIMMLREAKGQCDHLICAMQVDPSVDRQEKNQPVQTVVERYTQVAAVKYVDEIIVYQTEKDLEDILELYPIDVRILGEEYKIKILQVEKFVRKEAYVYILTNEIIDLAQVV